MKIVIIAIILLLGGAGAAWYMGYLPLPIETSVTKIGDDEKIEVRYDNIEVPDDRTKDSASLQKNIFKKKEYTEYDFSEPSDRIKARRQVEIEISEEKEELIDSAYDSSGDRKGKKEKYRAVTKWLGKDGTLVDEKKDEQKKE